MVRASQSFEKAALIYQHSDEERQREVGSPPASATWSALSVRSATTTKATTTTPAAPTQQV